MLLKNITKKEYSLSTLPTLFGNLETDRNFGIIPELNFKISWQSTDILPIISHIFQNKIYSIGIDQNFAVINKDKKEVLVNSILDYFFYGISIINEFLYVVTELEIIKYDLDNFQILKKYGLPEIFEKFISNDHQIKVKCLDGNIIFIE